MTKQEFNQAWNGITTASTTFKDGCGHVKMGRILDVGTSTNGTLFVYVDNFQQRVPVSELIAVF